MNSAERKNLWDSIPEYKRRNPESTKPPSQRIDPDVPGAHFWVIISTNWQYLHPLVQDVLSVWYKAITRNSKQEVELDPDSTEALERRLKVLYDKLNSFELERSNLEQELTIRDRDFQRLRQLSGRKEKENLEVQQQLGKSFQDKITSAYQQIEEQTDLIQKLEGQIEQLKQKQGGSDQQTPPPPPPPPEGSVEFELRSKLSETTRLLRELSEKTKQLKDKVSEQQKEIATLREESHRKDETIKHIKGLLKQ